MKKLSTLSLLSVAFLATSSISDAVEVKRGVDVGFGYSAQVYSGKLAYSKADKDFAKTLGGEATNTVNQISLYVGYNAIFNVYKYLNPMVGAFISGHIPLNNTYKMGNMKSVNANIVDVNVKIGNQFNICKDLNIDAYYFIGANIALARTTYYNTPYSNVYGGVSTGIGVDALYKGLMFGIYYKYTDVRTVGYVLNKSNNVGIKLGYRFSI